MAYERKTLSSGNRIGRWTVLKEARRRRNYRYWLCRCACGTKREVAQYTLTRRKSLSCRCTFTRHGEAGKTAEYKTWRGMRQRCLDPKVKEFKHYGGRGIRVCKRWNDYRKFLADVGRRPPGQRLYSLERINNDGHYKPSNVRWATNVEQARNRRYLGRRDSKKYPPR